MTEELKTPAATRSNGNGPQVCILAYAPRERTRTLLRGAFPKKRTRVVTTRTPQEFVEAFKMQLVDAAVVDLCQATEEAWRAANISIEFPSTPFFGLVPMRAADGPVLARCTSLEFADVLVDGVDDCILKQLISPYTYTTRFVAALSEAPTSLGLVTEVQTKTWRAIIAHAGRTITTDDIAHAIGYSREHLSREFSQGGAPNLKRVIDLVRIISAGELSKNPGYDMRDVAKALGFASSSHLAVTAHRVIGTRPASLSRLRTVDLIDRFIHGRTRSRDPRMGVTGDTIG